MIDWEEFAEEKRRERFRDGVDALVVLLIASAATVGVILIALHSDRLASSRPPSCLPDPNPGADDPRGQGPGSSSPRR